MTEEDLYGTGVDGFKVIPIPEGADNKWEIYVDGVLVPVRHIVMRSPFGVLRFGLRVPDDFVGPVYEEDKGGVTSLECTLPDGKILVGLIKENRANMGREPSFCILGGVAHMEENKTACILQIEKSKEKVGIDSSGAEKYPGLPTNWNRLLHVCKPSDRESGTRYYRLEIPPEAIEPAEDGFFQLVPEFSVGKKSHLVRFVPIEQVPYITGDIFAWAACFLRLLREKNQSI